jgi:hypothetical protein
LWCEWDLGYQLALVLLVLLVALAVVLTERVASAGVVVGQ